MDVLHSQQLEVVSKGHLEDFNSVLGARDRAAEGMSWVHLLGAHMPVFFTVPDGRIFVWPRSVTVLPELPQKRLCL